MCTKGQFADWRRHDVLRLHRAGNFSCNDGIAERAVQAGFLRLHSRDVAFFGECRWFNSEWGNQNPTARPSQRLLLSNCLRSVNFAFCLDICVCLIKKFFRHIGWADIRSVADSGSVGSSAQSECSKEWAIATFHSTTKSDGIRAGRRRPAPQHVPQKTPHWTDFD